MLFHFLQCIFKPLLHTLVCTPGLSNASHALQWWKTKCDSSSSCLCLILLSFCQDQTRSTPVAVRWFIQPPHRRVSVLGSFCPVAMQSQYPSAIIRKIHFPLIGQGQSWLPWCADWRVDWKVCVIICGTARPFCILTPSIWPMVRPFYRADCSLSLTINFWVPFFLRRNWEQAAGV